MNEPSWRLYSYFHHHKINPQLSSWLLEKNSLTQRLKSHAHVFGVEIIKLKWGIPLLSERKLLQMKARTRAYLREVKLIVDNRPAVFCRVVIPKTSLAGSNRNLLRLRTQSLGELLFTDPKLQREDFELALIKPGHYYYRQAQAQGPALWGRRSIFYFHKKPLLVSEMFLENFKL